MNIHYSQVEKKSQAASYLLAALAIATALMMTLSLNRHAEIHWSAAATSGQVDQTVDSHLPVAIPAPLPPAEQVQVIGAPELVADTQPISVPQVIPAPAPSVP